MKKMSKLAAILLIAGVLASCSGEGCWKLEYKVNLLGVETTYSDYVYGDSEDIDYAIAKIKDTFGSNVQVTRSKVKKSEADCQ
ncbi:MAG: hypothetical protein NC346_01400 [Prevotella sp.]|nr:hypothetical protein [Bacteroidales bacterium]MCM1068534.1 hypothetical protein [Prevotella sp.]MCM1402631.1 hypothetical protein [Bacteroides sp.]MCM1442394.1 hypothetical protein [Muribaculum sp.]MCM1575369.1 hypothetical protein [Bacteroides sp.]